MHGALRVSCNWVCIYKKKIMWRSRDNWPWVVSEIVVVLRSEISCWTSGVGNCDGKSYSYTLATFLCWRNCRYVQRKLFIARSTCVNRFWIVKDQLLIIQNWQFKFASFSNFRVKQLKLVVNNAICMGIVCVQGIPWEKKTSGQACWYEACWFELNWANDGTFVAA